MTRDCRQEFTDEATEVALALAELEGGATA
jgi:hypothetical protein